MCVAHDQKTHGHKEAIGYSFLLYTQFHSNVSKFRNFSLAILNKWTPGAPFTNMD